MKVTSKYSIMIWRPAQGMADPGLGGPGAADRAVQPGVTAVCASHTVASSTIWVLEWQRLLMNIEWMQQFLSVSKHVCF